MLNYKEMIEFKQEINEILNEFKNKEIDMIDLNTFWCEIETYKIPLWRQKVKYCTISSFFLETKIEEMKNKFKNLE